MLTWLVAMLVMYLISGWVRSTIDRGAQRRAEAKGRADSKGRKKGRVPSPRGSSLAPDPYEVLGVEENATREEIQAAYKKLALAYHPDRLASSTQEIQDLAGERLREINAAYAELGKRRRAQQ